MNQGRLQSILLALLLGMVAPLWAKHGTLASHDREDWVNAQVDRLVAENLVPIPSKSAQEMTNLEVVQLTEKAGERLMAQLPPPPSGGDWTLPPPMDPGMGLPGTLPAPAATLPGLGWPSPVAAKSVQQLVQEFKEELTALGVDLPQIEDRIFALQHRNESLAEQQKELLKRTGTIGSGFSRGYFNSYRGFGANAPYQTTQYNAAVFMDMRLKSIPVPTLLFDTTLRFWRTIGMYYADPISTKADLRWIALTDINDYFSVTAGDFYLHYTPLTLWNYESPVYTLLEPTSFQRNRKDVEELVFMDKGPDFRMRGIQAATDLSEAKDPFFSNFHVQAMASPLKQATTFGFGDYLAGSEASLSLLDNNVEFKGNGLLIWDDAGSANVPYNPNFPLTFAKQYHIGSVSGRVGIPFASDVSLTGAMEYAGSRYQDDMNDPTRAFQDWAFWSFYSLNISGFHLTAKYIDVGSYYYSPGAQANRYAAGFAPTGYLGTNDSQRDEALIDYLNRFPLTVASRPSFAPYDRIAENALPYGDATPDRQGMVVGVDLAIGEEGWFHPKASFLPSISGLQMMESQTNYVLNNAGTGGVAVDTQTALGAQRIFSGWEAALTAELAKPLQQSGKTYQLGFDYKNQETSLETNLYGPSKFTVDTLIGSADFNVPFQGFDSVVLSVAFEQAQSKGYEYVLNGVGNPSSLASYSFYLDSSALGQYSLAALNITRTTWAFGFKYPLSSTIALRGDLFLNTTAWSDVPGYDRTDQIMRFTYEARF